MDRLWVKTTATGLLCLLAALAQAGTHEIRVATPDGERPALVVEADSPGPAPRPLVLLLHGHMGSAAQALGMKHFSPSPLSAWVDIARRDDIVVAALDGNRGSDGEQGWNDCRGDAGNNPHSDDVAYARAVVKQLEAEGRVDPARIYAMGMSNGGMMAFRLGLEMPELAAFAAVSASMAADSRCPEPPPAQTAALIISGDADPLVPYLGGQVHFGRGAPRGGVIPVPAAFLRPGAWSVLAMVLAFYWYWRRSHRLAFALLLAFAVLGLLTNFLYYRLGGASLVRLTTYLPTRCALESIPLRSPCRSKRSSRRIDAFTTVGPSATKPCR